MGFFCNLKKITESTFRAANNGAELLTDLANEVERSTELVAARYHALSLSNEIEALSGDPEKFGVSKEKKNELMATYEKIIEGSPKEEKLDFLVLKKGLERELIEDSLKESLVVMRRKEKVFLKSDGGLAIDEINKLKLILSDIGKILPAAEHGKNLGSEYAGSVFLECGARKKEIQQKIEELEPERHVEYLEKHPSGKVKCKVLEYDGKRHGLSEYWYEGGHKEKEISFLNGKLSGVSRHWRNDGNLLSEIEYSPYKGAMKMTAYSVDGVKVLDGKVERYSGVIELWLWNGESLGSFSMRRGKFDRCLAMLKILTKIRLLKVIYKARKPGVEREGLKENLATVRFFSDFNNEILSMQSG